jgi:hypothetical protein
VHDIITDSKASCYKKTLIVKIDFRALNGEEDKAEKHSSLWKVVMVLPRFSQP